MIECKCIFYIYLLIKMLYVVFLIEVVRLFVYCVFICSECVLDEYYSLIISIFVEHSFVISEEENSILQNSIQCFEN